MCLIAFAWQSHPRWKLVLVGNRDEFHARAATAAEFQPDAPHVYGGRDLEKQGGWLQVSRRGRLATVTNVRAGRPDGVAPRSRGALVAGFVRAAQDNATWLDALAPAAAEHGRFNLLLWDGQGLMLAGNHPAFQRQHVAAGVHGLSNGPFDAPWPKVRRARAALQAWISAAPSAGEPELAPLFEALADERIAPDEQLPDTGVGLALERVLSAPFIRGPHYGTRCSNVVLVDAREVLFVERRFGPDGVALGETRERIALA
jgi:uncharacterized protein with NRDE domain